MREPVDFDISSSEADSVFPGVSSDLYTTWYQTAVSTAQADPFCCAPVWQLSFHNAFSPRQQLFLKTSKRNIIAFAEKIAAPNEIYLTPVEASWFFGCPLMGKDSVEFFSDLIGNIEKYYYPFFPRIIISGIRPNGKLSRRLIRAFAGYFYFFLHSSGAQCAASLADGIDGYLARRSGNHRKKLKKQQNKILNKGVWFERVKPLTVKEAEKTFARIYAVELKSWKGLGQCGMDQEPSTSFYRIMLRRLSLLKQARVIFARHENEDIGFIMGGLAGKIYRGQQFSYAENWRDYSIGNLLQVEKIKWLCEEGIKRYDMGPVTGPKMGYKAHWTEKNFKHETWILLRKKT